jgi:hypothetical protein
MQHFDTTGKQIEFKTYLENSPRIIFSAKFGDGKTQFLKEVAQSKIFKDYQFFTIYPVNYVVAENADIFEYVKRDILIQMAKADLLNSIDLNALMTSFASFETFKEVLSFLVSCMPAGDFINKLIEKGLAIKDEYDKKKATLGKYNDIFTAMRGGIYEEDAYTQIIREGLNYLRDSINAEGGNKKSVLVIEDLDRLDPGHLFRILNVISAHIDNPSYVGNISDNKFGFDNIVIVMDYSVTKRIFEHFYGPDASYEGYMSKFLTCQPFYYSIDSLAKHALYSHIVDLIGLTELVECMPNLKEHIKAMSVRDIERVINFDYRNRKKKDKTQIMAYWFSCDLPIFKLLCIMIECGLNKREIQKDLALQGDQNVASYIELVYPLHLQASDVCFNCYHVNNSIYDVCFKQGVIDKIDVQKVASRRATTKDIGSLNIVFWRLFRMMDECYNVSSLKLE